MRWEIPIRGIHHIRANDTAMNGRNSGDTGSCGIEGFADDSKDLRLVSDGGTSCFQCHTAREASGHVFTHWRD